MPPPDLTLSLYLEGYPLERRRRMRGQHLRRALGSTHRATTDSDIDLESPRADGDVSAAWAVAFIVVVLLGLLSPIL
jgi:hypothetical protein